MATEKRLIDANALKAEFTGNFHEKWHYTGIRAMIDVAPTVDAVEVVRCKECKYIRPEVDAYTHEVVGHWCSLLDLGSVEYEHFCSYGEKRDGE